MYRIRYHFYTSFEVGLDVHVFGDFHLVRVVAADVQMGFEFQRVHVTVFDSPNWRLFVDRQSALLFFNVTTDGDRRPLSDFQILSASQHGR